MLVLVKKNYIDIKFSIQGNAVNYKILSNVQTPKHRNV